MAKKHNFENQLERPTLEKLPESVDGTNRYEAELMAAWEDLNDALSFDNSFGRLFLEAWYAQFYNLRQNSHPATIVADIEEVNELIRNFDNLDYTDKYYLARTFKKAEGRLKNYVRAYERKRDEVEFAPIAAKLVEFESRLEKLENSQT